MNKCFESALNFGLHLLFQDKRWKKKLTSFRKETNKEFFLMHIDQKKVITFLKTPCPSRHNKYGGDTGLTSMWWIRCNVYSLRRNDCDESRAGCLKCTELSRRLVAEHDRKLLAGTPNNRVWESHKLKGKRNLEYKVYYWNAKKFIQHSSATAGQHSTYKIQHKSLDKISLLKRIMPFNI